MFILFNGDNFLMRLEPVMRLSDDAILGYELLSRPKLRNAECFFHQLSDKDVWRFAMFQIAKTKVTQQKLRADGHKLFINLRANILYAPDLLKDIIDSAECPLVIEIELKPPLLAYWRQMRKIKQVLSLLHRYGHELWLDDYKVGGPVPPQHLSLFNFQGIKIDKNSFWSICQDPRMISTHLDPLKSITPNILIEGIENKKQHAIAAGLGACFGQGYLWSSLPLL